MPVRDVTLAVWARGLLFAFFFLVSSCSFFSRPPPLPRRAAIEPTGSGEKFTRLIEGADIIYFPSESVVLDSRSEAAWKLLEALRRSGGAFAVGWDLVGREDGVICGEAASGEICRAPPAQMVGMGCPALAPSNSPRKIRRFSEHRGESRHRRDQLGPGSRREPSSPKTKRGS
jgi:hypothetical protein